MTDSSFDTSTYNVRATIRNWVNEAIASYPPALATGATLVLEMPEEPIATPVYAVIFDEQIQDGQYTGGIVGPNQRGSMQLAMAHVIMYGSRTATNWRGQLAQMADAVRKAFYAQPSGVIIIQDYALTPGAPTDTAYKLVLRTINQSSFPASLNPAIEGAALHLTYRYVERV